MPAPKVFKPHIHLGATGKRESYTRPIQGGARKTRVPHRNRQQHGQALLAQLQVVTAQQAALAQEAEAYELESIIDIQVEFPGMLGDAGKGQPDSVCQQWPVVEHHIGAAAGQGNGGFFR